MSEDEPTVRVRVEVNIDSLRRGWEGDVELTPRIQALLNRGYLRLLGHVLPPASAPAPEPMPLPVVVVAPKSPTPPETPDEPPSVSPAKRRPPATPRRKAVSDGDSPSAAGV